MMRLAQTQLRTPAPVFPPPDSTKSGRGLEFGKEVGPSVDAGVVRVVHTAWTAVALSAGSGLSLRDKIVGKI